MERLTLSQQVTRAWEHMVKTGAHKTYQVLEPGQLGEFNELAVKLTRKKSPKIPHSDPQRTSILLYLIAVKRYIQT